MKYRSPSSSSMATNESGVSTASTAVSMKSAYYRIKLGLRRSNPAAIVLWAFHKIPSKDGLTSRRVINFLKRHYRAIDNPGQTGKSIGAMLRCAVDFGLLQKRKNRYYLAPKNHE